MKSILAVACGVLCLEVASAQQLVGPPTLMPVKMAFVDVQRVATESIEGKAVVAKVQTLTQQKSAELESKTKALAAAQQKIKDGGQALSEEERVKTQKEMERLSVDIERFKQDANQEIQTLRQALLEPFQDKVRPILDALIKELGIQVVFNRGQVAAFLVDPRLDITAELIKRLDSATSKPETSNKP